MWKLAQSHHCPIVLTIKVEMSAPLQILDDCAIGTFSYDHYDVSKRLRRTINIKDLNLNGLYADLEHLASQIQVDGISASELNDKITDGIYNACIKNKEKHRINLATIPNAKNCTSDNFKAIAEANYQCYKYHEMKRSNKETCDFYREKWLIYHTVSNEKKNSELNIKKN